MKKQKYRVKVELVFESEIDVTADSTKEAQEIIENKWGALLGPVSSILPEEDIVWDVNIHPLKVIKSNKKL